MKGCWNGKGLGKFWIIWIQNLSIQPTLKAMEASLWICSSCWDPQRQDQLLEAFCHQERAVQGRFMVLWHPASSEPSSLVKIWILKWSTIYEKKKLHRNKHIHHFHGIRAAGWLWALLILFVALCTIFSIDLSLLKLFPCHLHDNQIVGKQFFIFSLPERGDWVEAANPNQCRWPPQHQHQRSLTGTTLTDR